MSERADLAQRLGFLQNATGAVFDPFQSFLARRGLLTLELRVARHAVNELTVARFLEGHPKIERAVYPGLESPPPARHHREADERWWRHEAAGRVTLLGRPPLPKQPLRQNTRIPRHDDIDHQSHDDRRNDKMPYARQAQ